MRFWHLFLIVAAFVAQPGGAEKANLYRFAPGDTIDVTVAPQRDFDRTLTIQPDGKISYPVAGQLQAAGLTVEQLTEKLRQGLTRDLVGPHVTVTLKQINNQAVPRISLLGAVRNPGVFPMKDGTTVAEILAAAGGPLPLANLHRVTVTRNDSSVRSLDLAEADKTGHLEQNILLQAGDLIVVPEGPPPTVFILGEVIKPGSVELHGASRLLDVLSLAGGPTPKADLHRVTVGRAGAAGARTLDLQSLLTGAAMSNPELNVLLQPGDTIMVPETEERVYVLGRVTRPDTYPIKPNDRVLDALARAGGTAPDGDTRTLVLIRRDSKGQPVARPVDLKKMMARGDMVENELLHPGDVLFVPDKKIHRPVGEITSLLWPLSSLLNLIR